MPKLQFSAVFIWIKKWRFDLLRGEWNNLIEGVLLFASCSFTSGALNHVHVCLDSGIGNSSCQSVVNLQVLFQLIQYLLAGIYFSFYFKLILL